MEGTNVRFGSLVDISHLDKIGVAALCKAILLVALPKFKCMLTFIRM